MSQVNLNPKQERIRQLIDTIIFKTKPERTVIIDEVTKLNQQITNDEQVEVVNSINESPALRFLAATGIRGDGRIALFAKLAALEKK